MLFDYCVSLACRRFRDDASVSNTMTDCVGKFARLSNRKLCEMFFLLVKVKDDIVINFSRGFVFIDCENTFLMSYSITYHQYCHIRRHRHIHHR